MLPALFGRDHPITTFDLEALHAKLLAPLLPHPPRQGESLQEQVERMAEIEKVQRELERCETRLAKEKQFNRKVAINEEINEQKAKLDQEINDNPSTAEVRSFFQSASRELDTALAFKHDKDYFTFENNLPIVQKEKTLHNGYPSFYFALCIWSWFDDLLNFASKIDHIRYSSKDKSSLMKLEILSNGLVSRQSLASLVRGASPSLFKNESILFARSSLKLLTEEQKEILFGYTTDRIEVGSKNWTVS